MAKLKVFTVYDQKVEAYLQPFYMRTQGEACRAFEQAVNDPKTQFSKHPEDFTLFYVGEYDEDSGRHESLPAPLSLGVALEYHKGSETYNPTLKGAPQAQEHRPQ